MGRASDSDDEGIANRKVSGRDGRKRGRQSREHRQDIKDVAEQEITSEVTKARRRGRQDRSELRKSCGIFSNPVLSE